MNIAQLYEIFLQTNCVTTDSRVGKGIFFGLPGEKFNGADFANDALNNGAEYAVTENALETLQALALYHRKQLKCPILAITGTNGKTTTKELIVQILQSRYNIGYTKGNFNNHIGVPLTLLSFDQNTDIGVVEMGANHIGDIAQLCKIALPNVGLITNIGYAHLEGFGDIDGVIKTKGELYDFLNTNKGTILYNEDDPMIVKMVNDRNIKNKIPYKNAFKELPGGGLVEFGFESEIYKTELVGNYNLKNITAACAVGQFFNITTKDAIIQACQYVPSNNRSQVIKTERNVILLDAYNANPSSMKEALINFNNLKVDNKVVILGDMKELGQHSTTLHQELNNMVNNYDFKQVILIGKEFKSVNVNGFDTLEQVLPQLQEIKNCNILIKGSRSLKLEQLVQYL